MKTLFLKMTLVTLFLTFSGGVLAQQRGNIDDAIKTLINNIERLEATSVPLSMRTTHRQNINEQRIDLIALLGEKKGEVQSYAGAVSANLTVEQRDKLSQQLSDLDNQIAFQKKALQREMLADTASTNAPASDAIVGEGGGSSAGNSDDVRVVGGNGVTASLPISALASINAARSSTPMVSPATSLAAAPDAGSSSSPSCSVVKLAPSSYSIREQQICSLVNDVAENKLGLGEAGVRTPEADIRLEGAEDYIVNIITEAKTLGDVQDTRTDKQNGSDVQARGTTSLVLKGGTPAVLSWAVENGAATSTTSGSTITFRFNPLGMIQALNNKTGYFTAYDDNEKDPFTKFLRKTSFGVSFDTGRGDQPGVFTGNKRQLSAFSARYEFVSDRDPRNQRHATKWANLVDKTQVDYTNAAVKLRGSLVEEPHCADPGLNPCPRARLIRAQFKDPVLQKWLEETNAQLRAIQPADGTTESAVVADVEKIIRKQVGLISIDKIGGNTRNQIISFVESLDSYLTARDTLLDEIAKGKVMAFEYTNHREVNAPDTSNFTFIAEKGTVGRMDLTFNAALNLYNQRPTKPNIKRIRDFVFAGQFDAPLREISGVGQPVFSIAGRFERTTGNAFALDGTLVPNTKGDVGSLQLKFLLPIKGTGVRLPFSVTFANRSELIREKEVRTNFGFTFDLDRLFSNNPFFKK